VEVEKMVLYHKKQVYQEDQGVELVIQVLQVQVVLEEQETVHLQVHHKEIQEEIHQMHHLDSGAGGGGASAAGAVSSSGVGGNGGAGSANSITNSPVTYAGGGGGAVFCGGTAGSGGAGGGGAGSNATGVQGTAGTVNTGGGGGGTRSNPVAGGNGGSGIVIVRAPGSANLGASPGTNTVTTLPAPAGGCKVATFTVSGTLTT
jgi:hypothetical protein